jgi:hypothetical protein
MDTLLMTGADVLKLLGNPVNPTTISPVSYRLLGQPVWTIRWEDWKSPTHTNIQQQLELVAHNPRILIVHKEAKVDPRGIWPPYYLIRFAVKFTDEEMLAYAQGQNDPVLIGRDLEAQIQKAQDEHA